MGWENVRTWLLAAVATLAILSALYIARAAPTHAEGPTLVSGIISSPTTWTASGSPYIVTGNILVTRTVTLTVEPGVMVKFDGPYYLRVDGALKAIGTPAQPITFTSNKASPARGDWDSIRFSEGSTSASYDIYGNYLDGSTLQYVRVEYGGGGDPIMGSPTIGAYGAAAPFMFGSVVRQGSGPGIYVQEGATRIISNIVEENQGLSPVDEGAIEIEGPATVLRNTVRNNGRLSGIHLSKGPALVANNTVVSNTGSGVYLRGGSGAAAATILSNTISGNMGVLGFGPAGGIYVGWGSTAAVLKNLIVGNKGSDGGGVLVRDGASAVLEGNVIRDNVAGASGGGVYASGTVTVTFNDIRDNVAASGGGLYIAGAVGPISFNNIMGNTPTALHNTTSAQVSAPYNYWGTTDTSAIDAAIYDFYDDFDKGIVSYTPVLTQPISFPLRYTYLPVIARNRAGGW